jgi:hypothetical protein
MEYNGCPSFAKENCQQAKEYTKDIIFTTKGVPHFGIP